MKLKAKFPPTPDRGDAGPGPRREDRAPALRRARDRHARGPQGGGRGRADPRRSRASARRPRRTSSPRSSGSASRARGRAALLLSKVRPVAEELAAALREHPAANRVEVAGSVRRWAETCKDIDLIATAEEPAALAEHLAGHPLIAAAGNPGPERRPRPDPQRRLGRPADRRPGGLRQPAPALHRLPGPQRAAARGRGRARPLGLRARHHRDRERRGRRSARPRSEVYERLGYAYIEPELREGRGELKAAREGKLPELVEVGDIRGDLHSHTTLSDGRNTLEEMAEAGREPRLRLPGDHRPLGQPRLRRPRHRRAALGADRGGPRPGTRASAASACSPARRSTSASTARSTTPTTCVAALDWVVASVHTSFSISEKEMTERSGRDREPARRLHRPPHRPPDRPPRALRDRRRGGRRGGGPHRHDARDQRQPQPPRPLRAPRPPRRRGRRRRSSSTPTPTASTPSTTWPTRSPPPAAPG